MEKLTDTLTDHQQMILSTNSIDRLINSTIKCLQAGSRQEARAIAQEWREVKETSEKVWFNAQSNLFEESFIKAEPLHP